MKLCWCNMHLSMRMVFIMHGLFHKSFCTENYFLIAAISLTTRGPLYTCLVMTLNYFHANVEKIGQRMKDDYRGSFFSYFINVSSHESGNQFDLIYTKNQVKCTETKITFLMWLPQFIHFSYSQSPKILFPPRFGQSYDRHNLIVHSSNWYPRRTH